MRKLSFILLFFVFTINISAQTNPYPKKFAQIDKYIDSVMRIWNIPGLALCIVYKDQLIYAKGYGYRDLENKLPVERYLFFFSKHYCRRCSK